MSNIPEIDSFCEDIYKKITDHGGIKSFFKNLRDNVPETLLDLAPESIDKEILRSLLYNKDYRFNFCEEIEDEKTKNFLIQFLKSWDMWISLFAEEAEEVNGVLISAYDLLSQCPRVVNDVMSCVSVLDLEALSEDFRVKTVFKLANPNKKIGGESVLLMSGRLTSFLGTIRIMLVSLMLRKSEEGLFIIPKERTMNSEILKILDEIQKVLADVRAQFEGLQSK